MQAIRYRIKAVSPLIFTSNTDDPNMVATLNYIPGTHLRGLFANEYIKRNNLQSMAERDEKFYRWFIKGELKFTNAYITTIDEYNEVHINYPVPLSIQREKHGSKIYDLLLVEEDKEIQTKPFDSTYCRLKHNSIYFEDVNKSLNFHHSRDRDRGVAKEGLIFNYESIDEGQVFEGFILGNADTLKEFQQNFNDGIYYLGRSRNNQYGKVKFEIITKQPQEFESELEGQIESGEAVLTLLSDTIIYNENGFPVVDIKEFEKVIGCTVKKAFIRANQWEGFTSIWRSKTTLEVCFRAGSAFLIEIKEDDIPKLKELQKKGIGMLTHLGFGRFVIGWQRSENLTEIPKDRKKHNKPNETPPQAIKTMLQFLTEEFLLASVQKDAIKKASEFKSPPSKSLLSKLEKAVTEDKLDELLKNLKTTAKNQLTKCRTHRETLYDFLKQNQTLYQDKNKLLATYKLDKISNEFQLFESNCADILKKLTKTYLTTLLSILRKKPEKGG
ncbi:hypothetical protein [Thermodesulfovibrio sp. TK110]